MNNLGLLSQSISISKGRVEPFDRTRGKIHSLRALWLLCEPCVKSFMDAETSSGLHSFSSE